MNIKMYKILGHSTIFMFSNLNIELTTKALSLLPNEIILTELQYF